MLLANPSRCTNLLLSLSEKRIHGENEVFGVCFVFHFFVVVFLFFRPCRLFPHAREEKMAALTGSNTSH